MNLQSLKTTIDATMVTVVTHLDRIYQEWFFQKQDWPSVSGQYYVGRKDSSLAVCTLGSIDLMRKIGRREEIAIVGKTFTENLGIEKMIRNVVSNPSIRLLLLCDKESPHRVGQSIVALKHNGIDAGRKIIGSHGRLPLLKNVAREEIERFQQQIEIIDLIGEEGLDTVMEMVEAAKERNLETFRGSPVPRVPTEEKAIEQVTCWHRESVDYEPDSAGFFVIQIDSRSREILAEHYSTEFVLQRVLHGKNALEIYSTMIRKNWVTNRGHAAYLGRELGKAELALERELMYEQNKELMKR